MTISDIDEKFFIGVTHSDNYSIVTLSKKKKYYGRPPEIKSYFDFPNNIDKGINDFFGDSFIIGVSKHELLYGCPQDLDEQGITFTVNLPKSNIALLEFLVEYKKIMKEIHDYQKLVKGVLSKAEIGRGSLQRELKKMTKIVNIAELVYWIALNKIEYNSSRNS